MSRLNQLFASLFSKKGRMGDVTIINGVVVSGDMKNSRSEDYGPVVQHPVEFNQVSAIKIIGPFETIIQQSSEHSIKLEINEKLIPFLKVKTVNGVWTISVEKDVLVNPVLKLWITAPLLESINCDGMGKVDIKEFKQENIKIKKSGAGKCSLTGDFSLVLLDIFGTGSFTGQINAKEAIIKKDSIGDGCLNGVIDKLVLTNDGTGSFDYTGGHSSLIKINQSSLGLTSFSGSCDTLEVVISGVGGLDAKQLHAKDVTLQSTGIGGVKITALNSIVGAATGIGGVHIFGNPQNARVTKKSIGELVYH